MSWEVLIILSVLLYCVSVLFQKILLKDEKSDPIAFSIVFQLGVGIVIGVVSMLMNGRILLPSFNSIWLSVILMSVLYGFANVFVFSALKRTQASIFTIIFSSKTIISVIGASLIFSESLTIIKWFGLLLILFATVWISFKKVRFKLGVGETFSFLAALLFGLAGINDRFLVKFFDPLSYVVVGFILPAVFLVILYPKKLVKVKFFLNKKYLLKLSSLCFLYGASAALFFKALAISTNSSLVFSINAFSGVLIVIFSLIFLKERDNLLKKIIGGVLGLIGLLLLSN